MTDFTEILALVDNLTAKQTTELVEVIREKNREKRDFNRNSRFDVQLAKLQARTLKIEQKKQQMISAGYDKIRQSKKAGEVINYTPEEIAKLNAAQ